MFFQEVLIVISAKFIFRFLSLVTFLQFFALLPQAHAAFKPQVEFTLWVQGERVLLKGKMKSGWHIYWQNPGDSGLSTSFSWSLSEKEWKFLEVKWPTPELFKEGDLVTYGYHEEVNFPVIISEELKGKLSDSELNVKVNWLACKHICVPGQIVLPFSYASPLSDKMWNVAFSKIPTNFTESNVSISFQNRGDYLEISSSKQPLYFYPQTLDLFIYEKTQFLEKKDDLYVLKVKKNSFAKSKNPLEFQGVLVWYDETAVSLAQSTEA